MRRLLVALGFTLAGCGGATTPEGCSDACGDPAVDAASSAEDLGCGGCGKDGAIDPVEDLGPLPSVDLGPPPIYASMTEAAAALAPGSWYPLPAKNKLADVFAVAGAGDNWQLSGGPRGVVNAWSGGAVAQGKLFLWGGGHNDYGGNEVYTFDLGSWTFERLTEPSNYVTYPCGGASACATVDDTPVSAHSYEGLSFIPTLGRFWVGGGAVYSTVGGFGTQSSAFDLGTKSWTKLPAMPHGGSVISAWDPTAQKLLVVLGAGSDKGGAFFTYNPATNKYENDSTPNWSVGSVGDLDTDHHKLVLYDDAKPNQVYVYDLSTVDLSGTDAVDWHHFDYQTTYKNGAPFRPSLNNATGMVYVAARKLFVLWDGRSSDVWTLDPTTWSWTQITAVNAGPTPSQESHGVYGRWRWLPEYGVFLAYDNIDESPWIYKLP